ncbi:MAG: hypothetical protein ACI80F_002117, partial [Natronomonas sp.]
SATVDARSATLRRSENLAAHRQPGSHFLASPGLSEREAFAMLGESID